MHFDKSSFQRQILAFFGVFLSTSTESRSSASASAVCPVSIANANLIAVFQNLPPYVIDNDRGNSQSKYRNGLIYDFVKGGLGHCFKQYNCNTKEVVWKGVFSEDDLSGAIVSETAVVAIPIAPSLSSSVTDKLEDSQKQHVTLMGVLISPGLAMVIDYNACKKRIEKLTTSTILSAWPICAVMLLLAGISGISVWVLVSTVCSYKVNSTAFFCESFRNHLNLIMKTISFVEQIIVHTKIILLTVIPVLTLIYL